MNITHLTSAHSRFDTRIFSKMCRSLANFGHAVTLIVADGRGAAVCDGVTILDVGPSKGRFDRIRNAPGRVFDAAVGLESDIYHLHDPELIPVGLKLKKLGRRVIFDSHEDAPMQMLSKPYLSRPVRWAIAQALRIFEIWACRQFDGVVAATPFIRNKFLAINPNSIDINNYPLLHELVSETAWEQRQLKVCYVGGIARIRGIIQIVSSMDYVSSEARLVLAGGVDEAPLKRQLSEMAGWRRVDDLGFVDREGVRSVLASSMAGLVTFLPEPNHIDAQPNKMFEYMSAGIPVIASNFPLWREIIEGSSCGLLVDPLNSREIAGAIDYLVANPIDAERMGRNGRKSVLERYNWTIEERKLVDFYEQFFK